MLIFAQNLRTN